MSLAILESCRHYNPSSVQQRHGHWTKTKHWQLGYPIEKAANPLGVNYPSNQIRRSLALTSEEEHLSGVNIDGWNSIGNSVCQPNNSASDTVRYLNHYMSRPAAFLGLARSAPNWFTSTL